ncbi:uracil phosphoribosyltransferase [Sarracenia purpurea var. burkii]
MESIKFSIQLLLLVFLSSIFSNFKIIKLGSCNGINLNVSCISIERKALLTFKQGLVDPSGRLSTWVGFDCCRWEGVRCEAKTSHVVKLKLRKPLAQNLVDDGEIGGEINPSLLGLKHLRFLDLSMNNFGGNPIPDFIGSLENLRYLNLSAANFGGTIPPSFGNLSRLLYLDLNSCFGELSSQNDLLWLSGISSLKHLNLGSVGLNLASNHWLQTINLLPSLSNLYLPGCGLSNLPPSLSFVNLTSLSVLDLSNNGFNSSLPNWLFNFTSLSYLDLSSNTLYGGIPDEFAILTSLQYIDLSANYYIGGRLSRSLGKLCNLQELWLSSNGITGELTEFIDGLYSCANASLESMDLGYNEFGGFLPSSLGSLKSLKKLWLWVNSFTGSIPESIGNLTSLEELYLAKNQMNGTIPKSLGHLSALSALDLSENPWQSVVTEAHMFNLTSLRELFVSSTSPTITLVFNVSSEWVPPFKLNYLVLKSCQLGPSFPEWLRNQNELNSIKLRDTHISDAVPDWFLKLDLQVVELDLSYNQLSGRVPNTFALQDGALVDLSFNRFEGTLPLFPSNLSTLSLRSNLFSGTIPSNLGKMFPNLANYDVSQNFLHGKIPLSIREMKGLNSLSASDNDLSGEIPLVWDDKPNLFNIELSNNRLSGEIPRSMGSLGSLLFLFLGNNSLSGEIPSSLQNCTIMDTLDLGQNRFSGKLPLWIGERMSTLLILRLRSNSFTGHIPEDLCSLSSLHILDLAENNLTGSIPSCFGNLSGMTTDIPGARYEGQLSVVAKGREFVYQSTLYLVNSIDLSSNKLSGEMPEELTSLSRLGTLNLSMNRLTGTIPVEIGILRRLETLDLSKNQLSGPIPPSMASLTSLNHLNLSYNNLSGRIPTSNQFLTLDDASIYENNAGLCGRPLTTKCPGDEETSQPRSAGGENKENDDDDDDDDGDRFEAMWLYGSVGLGFIVGFWVVCGTLATKQSWRHTYFQFIDGMKDRLVLLITANAARLRRKSKLERRT